MGKEEVILCPRCGSEMKRKARCCLKCGYLNPEHPDNKSMNKYSVESLDTYSVGSGKKINIKRTEDIVGFTTVGNNTGSKKLCFALNVVVYLLLIVTIIAYIYYNTGSLIGVLRSSLYIYLLVLTILIFVLYSTELVYMKMNKKWWSSIIPIYNMMVLSDAVLKSSLLGLLVYIPVVGQIFLLYMLFKTGTAFKKSGFLTMLFPYIMFPIIGFGSVGFEGRNYVDEEVHAREKDYKRSKAFLIIISTIFILGIGMFIYNNFVNIKNENKKLSRIYYVKIAKKMLNKTSWSVEHNRYTCFNKTLSNEYVFYYPDVGDKFNIPFSLYKDVVSGYVIATKDSDGDFTYRLSLTDGSRGIPEISSEELNSDVVVDFAALDDKYGYGLECQIK